MAPDLDARSAYACSECLDDGDCGEDFTCDPASRTCIRNLSCASTCDALGMGSMEEGFACAPSVACGGAPCSSRGVCMGPNRADGWDSQLANAGARIWIPDEDGIESGIDLFAGAALVQEISVGLRVQHAHRGDLQITLASPAGTSQVVWARRDPKDSDTSIVRIARVAGFLGEPATGRWTLLVEDLASGDVGWFSWSLSVNGDAVLPE
jgi:hypothetical protein